MSLGRGTIRQDGQQHRSRRKESAAVCARSRAWSQAGSSDGEGCADGVSKCENAVGSLPCSYRRRRRRAVGISESVESAEDAFAEWHGCARVDAQQQTFGTQVPRPADQRSLGDRAGASLAVTRSCSAHGPAQKLWNSRKSHCGFIADSSPLISMGLVWARR